MEEINRCSEYSRHHTRHDGQSSTRPLLFAAETTKAPVAPTPPGLFSLLNLGSNQSYRLIARAVISVRLQTHQPRRAFASAAWLPTSHRNISGTDHKNHRSRFRGSSLHTRCKPP